MALKENSMDTTEKQNIQEPKGEGSSRGEGFAQILHDRARESSQQLHKLLLSYSTGLLAVYFIALTATDDAAKPGVQTISAIAGLIATGLAVLTGLIGLYADMKRNYFRASALQAKDKQRRDKLFHARDCWLLRQRLSIRSLNVFFVFGITSSVIYIIFRILDR